MGKNRYSFLERFSGLYIKQCKNRPKLRLEIPQKTRLLVVGPGTPADSSRGGSQGSRGGNLGSESWAGWGGWRAGWRAGGLASWRERVSESWAAARGERRVVFITKTGEGLTMTVLTTLLCPTLTYRSKKQ